MQPDPKIHSRRTLLDGIRRAERIARIDLAQHTSISQATVTTITAEMIRQGLIEEVPRDEDTTQPRRGRPRVDLKIRGAAYKVAGLKIADQAISVVLVDFEGIVLREHKHVMAQAIFPAAEMAHEIRTALGDAAKAAGIAVDAISAVGGGIAGIVDAARGFVHWSPYFKERNVEFGEMLGALLHKPVFIDNDANLVAKAEQYLGYGREVTDFIVITIESGVGMGIVLNNKLYRGARGCGAEFGHIKVQLDGALCRCGQRGCLEAYVADYALLREASVGGARVDDMPAEKRVQQLLADARSGDPTAQSIVRRSSRMFAMGLSNLVNIFDPQLIILSGERMQFDHLYAKDVMASVRDSIVQVDVEPPEVVIHKWGDFMWAQGAAAFALDGIANIALSDMPDHAT